MEVLIRRTRSFWLQVALAVGFVSVIVVAASVSRPYYMSRGTIGRQLLINRYADSVAQRAPWVETSTTAALRSAKFLHDRESFAMDLLRTGHVSPRRALTLADIAVREAYTQRIPPALVLGVMLTENDELKSSATS